ncbi:MAG: hypothetical protein P0S95_02190 [Rhabdochlamydiaceae bacterium]|nr:hypothetical protein [Candidatus Amphrikana amoebophyrae]
MSGLNSGGGINFNGPIQLSGLALSKKYILETMDNYVSFMSDMLSLLKEDIGVYATATNNSAKFESETLKKQALGDLVGGISSGLSGAISMGFAAHGARSDKVDLQESDSAKSEMGNHDEVLDGLNHAESEALEAPPGAPAGAGVGHGGAAPDDHVDANIRKLENGHSKTFKAFGKDGVNASGAHPDEVSYDDAKASVKELVRRSRDPESTDEQKATAKKQIERIKESFKDKRKIAQNNHDSAERRVSNNVSKRNQHTQMINSFTQAAASGAKYQIAAVGDGSQAASKRNAVFAQSNQQINQQILSSTEATAQKAAQHAEDLVQLERQIQANNITRG